MEEIQDSGKVWCKGSNRPVHAVRTGKEEDQSIECWVDRDVLYVDLHEPQREIRIARKFPLGLEPTLTGTLFNGFTRTKHADVSIVSSDQESVEEIIISGETYRAGQYNSMSSREFWNKVH